MKKLTEIYSRLRASEFRKVVSFEKVIRNGDVIPRFYGIAYRSFIDDKAICYPVPLNWLVRWGMEIARRLKVPGTTKFERAVVAAYQKGFKEGKQQAAIDFISELDREIATRETRKVKEMQISMDDTIPSRSRTHDEV